MALTALARRSLRSIQRVLASSAPGSMLDALGRNDAEGWSALAALEMRMLLARGQTHQAHQVADRLIVAANAHLPVDDFDKSEIHMLINAIDSVLAGRHYLALTQLDEVEQRATHPTVAWALQLWRAHSLAIERGAETGRAAVAKAIGLASEMPPDAKDWAICVAAEVEAHAGDTEKAEMAALHAISGFVGTGDLRGASRGYLTLAMVTHLAGATEESEAAADRAYSTDGSWCGPVVWLARRAIAAGDVAKATELLRSVPNPTSDAFGMLRALALVESRGIPLSVVSENLLLGDRPADDAVIGGLKALLEAHPGYVPARISLAWKHLMRDQLEGAELQLKALQEDEVADGQSVAALRFGLQTYRSAKGLVKPPAIPVVAKPEVAKPTAVPAGPPIADKATAEQPIVGGDLPPPIPATSEVEVVSEATSEVEVVSEATSEVEAVVSEATSEVEAVVSEATSEVEAAAPAGEQEQEQDEHQGAASGDFAGQLSLFGVPDLLQFFCNSRRSGQVIFSCQAGDAKVRLHEGSIYWVISPSQPALGQYLLDQQAINGDQLALLGEDNDNVTILVEEHDADVSKVRQALSGLIHKTIKDLVEWTDGWFVFDSTQARIDPRPELLFNAQGVLLDALREIDEQNR